MKYVRLKDNKYTFIKHIYKDKKIENKELEQYKSVTK